MRHLFHIIFILSYSISAHANDQELFVGAWDMVKFEVKNDTAEWQELVIENTTLTGSIVFTEAGIMHVQMVSSDRLNEEINANGEIENGYSAYFGRYKLDTDQKIVTYNRLGHLVEKYTEQEVSRHYEINDDFLHIYNSPGSRMIWKRIK